MRKTWLVLGLLLLPAVAPLVQKGYFPMHDDLQAMRQLQMDKCFRDGQIPCRWVADMGYGYGYPLFNYYPPLPYYLGQLVHWLGFSFIGTVKVMGIVGFAASLITMFLLAREFWGRRGGMLAALFYVYAPYHSTDFYVRAAVNEFWALVFLPAIFWTVYKLVSTGSQKWLPWLALSLAGLLLSHNPLLMIFSPLVIVWGGFWLWKHRTLRPVKSLAVAAIWALGLAAFFTLPLVWESKYAHIETLVIGYFNYLAHFLDLRQMFWHINWGYGESVYGPADTMSFAVGSLHWIVPAVVLLAALCFRKFYSLRPLLLLLSLLLLGSLFMSHFRATPIWLRIKPLEYLQFPWRFLALAIFVASFLAGSVAAVASRRLVSLLLLLLLLLNANYFRPRDWWPWVDDTHKFSGELWRLQTTAGIFDYLPKWAPLPPADPPAADVTFSQGQGSFARLEKRSNRQAYRVIVTSPAAVAELQTFYFPGWRVWVDGQEVRIDPRRDPILGRMQVDLTSGSHEILARFTNTPIRTLANTLSLVAWAALILAFIPWPKSKYSGI